MPLTLTKYFGFSASFSSNDKIYGHNYILAVTMECVDLEREKLLTNKIEVGLIDKVHSRDLGVHVDFLKNMKITEKNLLETFWRVIAELIAPTSLKKLSIERDKKTLFVMES